MFLKNSIQLLHLRHLFSSNTSSSTSSLYNSSIGSLNISSLYSNTASPSSTDSRNTSSLYSNSTSSLSSISSRRTTLQTVNTDLFGTYDKKNYPGAIRSRIVLFAKRLYVE